MELTLNKIFTYINSSETHCIFTPNAEIIMSAKKNKDLHKILSSADILVPDGAGVVLASKILGRRLKEKVSGVDITKNLLKSNQANNINFCLFGGKPGVAEKASENILKSNPAINITGCFNGYFSSSEENKLIDNINRTNPDIIFIGLGSPKQEEWIYKNKHLLNAKVLIGVGGAIDILAGTAKLAPEFMRRNGLEWLYRLYREPWRFKRMLVLPVFIIQAIFKRIF